MMREERELIILLGEAMGKIDKADFYMEFVRKAKDVNFAHKWSAGARHGFGCVDFMVQNNGKQVFTDDLDLKKLHLSKWAEYFSNSSEESQLAVGEGLHKAVYEVERRARWTNYR
jgi:hypothetical protein